MLIGIIGRVGEGKTTIAEHLQNHYGFKLLSFATPVKETVSRLFGIPMYILLDSVKKTQVLSEWNKTPRNILQIFGTECMRHHFGSDFWVNFMVRKIDWDNTRNIVIDDVRFQEEVDMVVRKGGQMIRVFRPNNPFVIDITHESEQIDRLNYSALMIRNTGTTDALNAKINQYCDELDLKPITRY